MAKLTMVQAINLALKQEMQKDSKVIVLGEDVGKDGGVFRVTEGLWQQFGDERVIDTPLAESGIVGISIGLAVNGMKPVAEIQFDGFTPPSYDQLINHAARIRNRSRGRFYVPMVLRFPYSGGIRALEHHSDSPEAYFCHAPGLKVVIPATPYDAKGLLISSIRDPDPIIFMEPKKVYRAIKEEVPEEEYTIPLGKAQVVREGKDITLIAWGSMVKTSLDAADKALEENINAEVINLRTLKPLDIDTVIKSVEKTGRAMIVQEAPKTCSFSSELATLIMEKVFLHLQAPVERVTGYDIVPPLPKLENYYYPNPERIIGKIKKVMSF